MKQHTESKNRFGLLIRQFRQASGHTQETLARAIGCDANYINMVEMNVKPPHGRFIIPWSNEIRMTAEQMIFLYSKESVRQMFLEAGLEWLPEADRAAEEGFRNAGG